MEVALLVASSLVFGVLIVWSRRRRRRPISYGRDGLPLLGHPKGCACVRQPDVHTCALAELYAAEVRRRS